MTSTQIFIKRDLNGDLQSFLSKQFSPTTRFLILCDSNTRILCLPLLIRHNPDLRNAPVVEIPAGEKWKTLPGLQLVLDAMLLHHLGRNDVLLNVGGGVVCDLGGMAASVFKRGIPYVNIPTTLISQCDASIGGKTAIDYFNIKNLLGTFYSPFACFMYTSFLTTLDPVHLRSGYAEIVKIALLSDAAAWRQLKNISYLSLIDQIQWLEFAVESKMQLVARDPYDMNIRRKLNLGHTLGHALEAYGLEHENCFLWHGEAVAAGILAAAHISQIQSGLSAEAVSEINKWYHHNFKMPSYPIDAVETVLSYLGSDKKNEKNRIQAVLFEGIAEVVTDREVMPEIWRKVFVQLFCKHE